MTGLVRPPLRGRARERRALSVALALLGMLALACAGPALSRRYQGAKRSFDNSARSAPPSTGSDEEPAAPLFANAGHLERAALVRAALRRNPSIRAARQAWKAALERYPQATSLEDPVLAYGVAPASFGSSAVDDAHKVELRQHLPFPGKLSLRGEIALAEADAAEQDLQAVRRRLAALASKLFDELYFLDRALAINAEHQELLDELLRIATARYEAGEGSQQDPLQAEVEREHLVHREVVLETARTVARKRLNTLLHRRPDRPLPAVPEALLLPPTELPNREKLAAEALRTRPEIRALEARIEARESSLALARREFLPDVTLAAGHNSLWQESDLQPFLGVEVNIPLRLDRRRAALAEAKARRARAKSERERLEDEIRLAVHRSTDRLEEARHVLRLFESRLVPAARDRVGAARTGYETGRNSFLALVEAERTLRRTRLGLEEARTNVSRRHAELERVLGRIPGLRGGRKP